MLDNNLKMKKNLSTAPVSYDAGKFAKSLGIINPYAKVSDTILSKQVEILEDAIKRYEKLEDIKKFTSLVLEDMETVTEDDINRAIEAENKISIDDDEAVQALLENEIFLNDLNI